MQPNPSITTDFFARLYDVDHNLERELAWSDPGQDAICRGERFAADNLAGFADRAAELNREGSNVYFTPALLEPGGRGRAHDTDVAAIPVLWADLDTAEAMRAPAKRYGAAGVPTCSIMTRPTPDVRLHYYWKLDEPMFGAGAQLEGRRLNQRIAAHMYGDLACCNPSRLLRVPGTVRHPTPDKPMPWPHLFRVCWFFDPPDLGIYTPSTIEHAFPPFINGSTPATREQTPVAAWVAVAHEGAAKGARNTTAARLIGYLLHFRIHEDIAWALVLAWNDARCSPPMDEDRLLRTFESIHEIELRRRILP